ncbi:hypothetical protein GCM10010517_79370 [Streptosporangium fragile]|uniref:Knr4/Smi1-like domain-containing protein n=1 Tax=Streptosporangium fragile TaxID=46186 RepID=A0ABN3WE78_9ACTN
MRRSAAERPPVPASGAPAVDAPGRTPGRTPGAPAPQSSSEAARRRLLRWGAVGLGLCVLLFGAQLLGTAAFSKGPDTQAADPVGEARGVVDPCFPQGPERYPADAPRDGECGPGLRLYTQPPDRPRTPTPAPSPGDGLTAAQVRDEDCHPRVGTPRVRPVSPRVTRAVNRQWLRIERWLRANAPETHRTLAGPGRARTIAIAEAQMGLRFPDDLRASLLRHDGAVSLGQVQPFGFLGNGSLGVRGIRDTWRQLCGTDGEADGGEGADPRADRWDGRMIPFGVDGSGDHLVIDSIRRDVGDADHESGMSFTPGGIRIRSYYALLKATADALETGGSVGHWKPGVADGVLRWETTGVGAPS